MSDPSQQQPQQPNQAEAGPSSGETQPLLAPGDPRREEALRNFKKSLKAHEDLSENLKKMRFGLRDLEKEFDRTENSMKALQSVGQIIGEVLKQLDDERCEYEAAACVPPYSVC